MMEIAIWGFVLALVGMIIVGAVIGFFVARWWLKRNLEKNPPINEKMIRVMFRQMGRTPSEKQVREIMRSMKDSSK